MSTMPTASAQVATVKTDKSIYTYNETITVSGTAPPNKTVAIQITDQKGTIVFLTTAKADTEGNFQRTFKLPPGSLTGEYKVTASEGGVSRETTFILYSVGPFLTITLTPPKPAYTTELVTIKVTSSESLQDAPTVTVTQSGAEAKPLSMVKTSSNQWSASYAVQRGYEGVAVINASGINLAGEVGRAVKTFTVDTTPPVISITTPEIVFEPKVTVSGVVDDATVSFIDLTLDAQPKTRVAVVSHAWSVEIPLPTTGTHSLKAEATDLAGNTGFATTTTNYLQVTGSVAVDIDLPEGTPGTTVPIWVYTTYEGRPIAVNNISGKVIQPDGTVVDLTFTAVKTGLFKALYTIPTVGTYAVAVDVSWHGVYGTAFKVFQGVTFDVSQLEGVRVSSLIAAGLSIAAAAAAIVAVVQITRKLVLK
ncbi:MAG: hypothetical protein QXJ75_02020 [Candidatus Bathyarchaeia archaeon]